MGSLDTNPDPKILEPNHETGSNKSEPLKDTPTTSNENDLFELVSTTGDTEDNDKKTLPIASPSSSISSTNSISKDSSQDSDTKHGGKVKEGDHTSETPPIQVMERPSTPKYRIPSSVFARKQSGNQDWAMASNESLFSIQMSFNYQDSFNWQSGDLERYVQEVGPISETDETHGSKTGKTHEEGIPKKHKKPNLQEKQGRKPVVDPRVSHVSAESESAKSFTFPVLTEETDKGGGGGSLEAISEKEQHEPEKQKAEKPPPTWTNCFGCCTFCC